MKFTVLTLALTLAATTAFAQTEMKKPEAHDKEHAHVSADKKDHDHDEAHHKAHDHKAHHPDHDEAQAKAKK